MWVFLGSELLLFSGLVTLFAAYRVQYPGEFRAAAEHANVLLGTINTYVLLTSSLTVALAIHAARHGCGRGRVVTFLAITIALGITFDVLKAIEYAGHLADGIAPGPAYSNAEVPAHGAVLYVTLYYLLTGLHALHVTAGWVVLAWLAVRVLRGRASHSHIALELGGLYWHLVDVVWIVLWPLIYLIR